MGSRKENKALSIIELNLKRVTDSQLVRMNLLIANEIIKRVNIEQEKKNDKKN